MARHYDEIALTDEERAELFESADVTRFASVGADGLPHVVPVAFTVVDGELCFETDADSVKVRNVEETGKGAAVVDAGEAEFNEHRGVQWRGAARVVDDREFEKEIERGLFGTVKSVPDAGKHQRVKIALTPDRTVSWDFRKVG
ncbi:pyridoxamine 5'-phosphate oxidase family protein [Halobellus rufus]|uniref:pyridoxamine 5'-phosphate oxidase family protein n=1 Tax=Halobellus rufus TaxID=1448860 RepID=UPI000678F016|nr:pyridoxamine 5'-phosphate oxidase family protein [Halobellus rufus]